MLEQLVPPRECREGLAVLQAGHVARLEVTPGVFGARVVGGGWGGCVLAVAEPGTRLEGGRNVVSDDGLYTLA